MSYLTDNKYELTTRLSDDELRVLKEWTLEYRIMPGVRMDAEWQRSHDLLEKLVAATKGRP